MPFLSPVGGLVVRQVVTLRDVSQPFYLFVSSLIGYFIESENEMKNELKLFYNKARQAAITNEILEIVAGAEALGG